MKFTQLFILQSAVIYFFGNLRAKFSHLNPADLVLKSLSMPKQLSAVADGTNLNFNLF